MSPKPIVVYDGECAFCRNSVSRLRRHDGGKLEYLARQAQEREHRFPQLNDPKYQGAMQLILPNGDICSGEIAVAKAFTQLATWYYRWLGYLMLFPLVRPFAHIVYKWIAKNRHRLSCDSGSCEL